MMFISLIGSYGSQTATMTKLASVIIIAAHQCDIYTNKNENKQFKANCFKMFFGIATGRLQRVVFLV